jgi:hypothetical protein
MTKIDRGRHVITQMTRSAGFVAQTQRSPCSVGCAQFDALWETEGYSNRGRCELLRGNLNLA